MVTRNTIVTEAGPLVITGSPATDKIIKLTGATTATFQDDLSGAVDGSTRFTGLLTTTAVGPSGNDLFSYVMTGSTDRIIVFDFKVMVFKSLTASGLFDMQAIFEGNGTSKALTENTIFTKNGPIKDLAGWAITAVLSTTTQTDDTVTFQATSDSATAVYWQYEGKRWSVDSTGYV